MQTADLCGSSRLGRGLCSIVEGEKHVPYYLVIQLEMKLKQSYSSRLVHFIR